MSVVTSAVIVVEYAPSEVVPRLTELRSWGRTEGYEQAFAEIDTSGCGGGKVLQSEVYAAGFNHIDPGELQDWFLDLPWGTVGAAVLIFDTEGDGRTVVCTPGWERTDAY